MRAKGNAIIVSLLIVAIAASIATALMMQERINIKRTQQLITANQTWQYAQGALYWGVGVVKHNVEGEWPQELPATEIAEGSGRISAVIEPIDARIDLNSLSNEKTSKKFIALLQELNVISNEGEAKSLIAKIIDWTNPITEKSDDSFYLDRSPPYRAAHQPMMSISELRLIRGVNADIYRQLEEKVIVVPSAFNEKTAESTSEATSETTGQSTESQETQVKTETPETGTKQVYFLLQINVQLHDQYLTLYSLLEKVGAKKPTVNIKWISRGTL